MKAIEKLFCSETVSDLATQIVTLLDEQSPSAEASSAATELAAAWISVQGVRGKVAIA